MKMYADLLAPNVVDCRANSDAFEHGEASVPGLDALATADDDGKNLVLALVNRHATDELTCSIDVNGKPVTGTVSADVLSGDSPDAYNDVDAPDRVAPKTISLAFENGAVKLPPHSLTICKLG